MENDMQTADEQESSVTPIDAPETEQESMEEEEGTEEGFDMGVPEGEPMAEEMPSEDQPKRGFLSRLFGGK